MQAVNSSRQIGHIVRRQRSAAHLTQKQLAKQAGVSERLIIALELGDATGIRLDKLLQILSTLDLSLAVMGAENDVAKDKKSGANVRYAVMGLPDLDYDLPSDLTFPSFEEKKR